MPAASRPPIDHAELSKARELAESQGSVVSRRQLYDMGVKRWRVRFEVRVGRWQTIGDQSICLHNGPVSFTGHLWAAVFQGGPRARLDGAAALVAAGLERYRVDRIRVSVPRGARVRRTPLYDIRQTRRWAADDVAVSRLPRTRPAVAAVRAALWAATDRQATYVLVLVVQQGVVLPRDLGEQLLRIRRDRRRGLLHATVNELLGGVRSLGELDVLAELRRRGLPEPERQVVRRDARGHYYLDLFWPAYGLVVEVDGIHHGWVENVVPDALRQNSLVLTGDTVLRVPLLGLRLHPNEFFGQIGQALAQGGYRHRAA